MIKREARSAIETQKLHMVAALYANNVFDESDEGLKARQERIDKLEESFDRAITLIYDPHAFDHEQADIDWNNPFWAAAKRAQDRREALVAQQNSQTVQDAVNADRTGRFKDFDQLS